MSLGFQWKVVNPYFMRCLFVSQSGVEVKLDLQLYQIDQRNYLLDFKVHYQDYVDSILILLTL